MRRLHALLDTLGQEKREIFVLAELEQLSVVEIAELLEVNLNTAYARLRAARAEFEAALVRQRANDEFVENRERGPRSSRPPTPPPLPARARSVEETNNTRDEAVPQGMRVVR